MVSKAMLHCPYKSVEGCHEQPWHAFATFLHCYCTLHLVLPDVEGVVHASVAPDHIWAVWSGDYFVTPCTSQAGRDLPSHQELADAGWMGSQCWRKAVDDFLLVASPPAKPEDIEAASAALIALVEQLEARNA